MLNYHLLTIEVKEGVIIFNLSTNLGCLLVCGYLTFGNSSSFCFSNYTNVILKQLKLKN